MLYQPLSKTEESLKVILLIGFPIEITLLPNIYFMLKGRELNFSKNNCWWTINITAAKRRIASN